MALRRHSKHAQERPDLQHCLRVSRNYSYSMLKQLSPGVNPACKKNHQILTALPCGRLACKATSLQRMMGLVSVCTWASVQ